MNLDDELRRLFRDDRLDVPVPEGMQQVIVERVRERRQRRRRPAWFVGGATVFVLIGGGVAVGAGLDVPLLGEESGGQQPTLISEASHPTSTSPQFVPAPLAPGTVQQLVPDPRELQQFSPRRLSPRPTQGGPLPEPAQQDCASPLSELAPFLGALALSVDPCTPADFHDPRIDRKPLPYSPDTEDPSEPTDPPPTSDTESSQPSAPPSPAPSSSAPPTE